MRFIFQTSHVRAEGNEVWSKLNQSEVSYLLNLSEQARQRKKAFYYSIQLYDGNKTLYPFLFIDIDSKDLEASLTVTIAIVKEFIEKGLTFDKDFSVAFSGSKGFHILLNTKAIFGFIPDSDLFPPKQQKDLVKKIFSELVPSMSEYLDDSIFGTHRMMRAEYSINNKSGLYKTPLTLNDLGAGLSNILTLAKRSQPVTTEFYSRFEISDGKNEFLSQLLGNLSVENEDVGVERERKKRTIKKSRISKSNDTNAYVSYYSCRALRQLGSKIISTHDADHNERLALASALKDSDLRDKLVHEILSKTEKYKRTITQEKIDGLNFVGTCEMLHEKGICKELCDRYKGKTKSEIQYPGYLSKRSSDVDSWDHLASSENIKNVAVKLLNYHTTTTDFFDWTNAKQFLDQVDLFAIGVSDYLRRLAIPESTGLLIKVLKQENAQRDLVRVGFETELLSSLFCEKGLRNNKKFKVENIKNPSVHSFGYQQSDTSGKALIGSWRAEYSDFRNTLKSIAETTPHALVLSTDLKSFYPKITSEHAKRLIGEIFKDARIIDVVSSTSKASLKNYRDGAAVARDTGLPQGPLIAHVIASRLLLKIDAQISNSVSPNDFQMVRYCDDFHFFIKDHSVLSRIQGLLNELEEKFEVSFHKEDGSEKVSLFEIEEYRQNQLDNDLYKYQVRFESELSKVDPDEKRELLRVITRLFDSRLKKYLSGDSGVNIKDLERDISAMQWRIPELVMDGVNFKEEILSLGSVICKFLESPILSHKLRTSLSGLLLGFVISLHEEIGELKELFLKLYMNGRKDCQENILSLLVRELCLDGSARVKAIGTEILKVDLSGSSHKSLLFDMLLKEIEYLVDDNRVFDEKIWGVGADVGHKNLAGIVRDLQQMEISPDGFRKICVESGTIFNFQVKYFVDQIIKMHDGLSMPERYAFFKVAYDYSIHPVKEVFWADFDSFLDQKLVSRQEDDFIQGHTALLKKMIFEMTKREPDRIEIVNKVNSMKIIGDGENYYTISFPNLVNFPGISNKKMIFAAKKLNSLSKLGEVMLHIDEKTKEIALVYKFPKIDIDDLSSYLDSSNSFDDILGAELFLFQDQDRLVDLILSAKNLGLARDRNTTKIIPLDVSQVLKDTINGTYTFKNESVVKVVNRKKSILPGRRIMEFNAACGVNDAKSFSYGLGGWEFLNTLQDSSKASFFNKKPSDVASKISSIKRYGSWIMKGEANKSADLVNFYCYSIFRDLYKRHRKVRLRQGTSSVMFVNYEILQNAKHILGIVPDKREGINQNLYRFVREDIELHKEFKTKNLPSIDLVTGYSLLFLYKSIDKYSMSDRAAVVTLALVGLVQIRNSMEELGSTYDIASGSKQSLEKEINSFFDDLEKLLRVNYLSPDLSNFKVYEDLLERRFNDIFDELGALRLRKLKLQKIRKVIDVEPTFAEDEAERQKQISTNFENIHLKYDVVRSDGIEIFGVLFFDKIVDYLRPETGTYLKDSFSRLHSWKVDTHDLLEKHGFVTTAHDKHVISCYPSGLIFYPRKRFGDSKLDWKKVLLLYLLSFICLGLIAKFWEKIIEALWLAIASMF
ncbi:DNA primase small subunit domain-containing protein [Bdellovibrio bacteriovorus]|uniref:Uncharacterized protein n=1 Tax=Bdellovibrio bacteriovorus (strain ATCC 15356 / DSM 50701 / NCIMB 9529 / HD100) TaxID=264462 RepID=Q6MJT8_BDEBA|nr:DNA primase small subunit domain-containing protein [Bdellovibrio bacteriovorus]CAE80471.1 hypothetical protein predicted by Glimmer/Critica [Bdellovibrio bacteriovorus HD100]